MLENRVIKIIENSLKKKYRNIIYSRSEIKNILDYKKKFLEKKTSIVRNYIFLNKIEKDHKKKYLLSSLLKNYYSKSKLTNKDKSIIFKFYTKFSANLKLSKYYDFLLKKKSKFETEIDSYVFLGSLIFKINSINKIQKLNCLLKLNDKVLINKKKYKNFKVFRLFQKNLKKELNLTNFFLEQ